MISRVVYHPTDPSKNEHFLDGKPVTKSEYDAVVPSKLDFEGTPGGHLPGCWPMVSNAMLVHPDQIKEAHEAAIAKGVPTEFTSEGQPILRDQAHRKAYVRAMGMHDRNGSYGDP